MKTISSHRFFDKGSTQVAVGFIFFLVILALCADIITGENSYSIVKYEPDTFTEFSEPFKPPGSLENDPVGSKYHLLGTDRYGRDVTSRLIHGTRSALLIGIFSTLLSFLIALFLGVTSGYYGNKSVSINGFQLVLLIIGIPLLLFYSKYFSYNVTLSGVQFFSIQSFLVSMLLGGSFLALLFRLMRSISKRNIFLPLDNIVLRLLEIFRSIPTLFLLIAIFAIIRTPTLVSVSIIIGLLRWPGLTRLLRGEVIKVKGDEYVQAGRLLGISDRMLIVKHVIPNALPSVIVALAFATSSAILLESALSFLEIGLPVNTPSWGSMMREARSYFPAWWLALFPGLMIFFSVLSFNTIGSRLNEYNNKRL